MPSPPPRHQWDLWHPPKRAQHTPTHSTSPQPAGFVSSSVPRCQGRRCKGPAPHMPLLLHNSPLARGHSKNLKVKDQPVHSYMAQPNPASRNKACQSKTIALHSMGVCRVRPRVPCQIQLFFALRLQGLPGWDLVSALFAEVAHPPHKSCSAVHML